MARLTFVRSRSIVLGLAVAVALCVGSSAQAGVSVQIGGTPSAVPLASNDIAAAARALAPSTTGNQSLAVLLVNFADNRSTPWTPAVAQSVVSSGLNSYYGEASNNRTSFTVTAFGWYQLSATTTGCDYLGWESEAFAQARAAGVDPASYNHVMIVLAPVPYSVCAWAGLGELGGPVTWINDPFLTVRTIAHELGHNFGLDHANAWVCPAGAMIGSGCVSQAYGDPFDDMGIGSSGSYEFSSWHKWQLGWLDPSEQQTVSATGDYSLVADEAARDSGVKLLLVPLANGSSYAVETRSATGQYDSSIDRRATTGALIRLVPTALASSSNETNLIDGNPGTATFSDAAFQVGECLSDPVNDLAITTVSASNGKTVVHVALGTTTCGGSGGSSGGGGGTNGGGTFSTGATLSVNAGAVKTTVGGTISYTAVVSAMTGDGGTQRHLYASLPAGASLVRSTSDHGSCVLVGSTVDCNLGALGAPNTAQVMLVFKFAEPGAFSLPFSVTAGQQGGDLTSSVLTVTGTVFDPRGSVAPPPPVSTAGSLTVGSTLYAVLSAAVRYENGLGYHWQVSDPVGKAVRGARLHWRTLPNGNTARLKLDGNLVGHELRLVVTIADWHPRSYESAATAPVEPPH